MLFSWSCWTHASTCASNTFQQGLIANVVSNLLNYQSQLAPFMAWTSPCKTARRLALADFANLLESYNLHPVFRANVHIDEISYHQLCGNRSGLLMSSSLTHETSSGELKLRLES